MTNIIYLDAERYRRRGVITNWNALTEQARKEKDNGR